MAEAVSLGFGRLIVLPVAETARPRSTMKGSWPCGRPLWNSAGSAPDLGTVQISDAFRSSDIGGQLEFRAWSEGPPLNDQKDVVVGIIPTFVMFENTLEWMLMSEGGGGKPGDLVLLGAEGPQSGHHNYWLRLERPQRGRFGCEFRFHLCRCRRLHRLRLHLLQPALSRGEWVDSASARRHRAIRHQQPFPYLDVFGKTLVSHTVSIHQAMENAAGHGATNGVRCLRVTARFSRR